jgi:NAD(P)-dependent dehydrogenase (short-subunit alcohol dehydrogenase family)
MKQAALITGGAKRIGKVVALKLAAAGYDIALHYHTSKKEAEETAKEIRALGVDCTLFPSALNNQKDAYALIAQATNTYKHLNVLINSASIFERRSFMETDEAQLEENFAVNFKVPFFLTQAFAKATKEKAHVVNMLDTYILRHNGHYFSYLLSKKTLAEFTKMAARELAPRIHVNAVCIGVTTLSENLDQDFVAQKLKHLPDKKLVKPEEISAAILSLIQSSYLNGQLLFVDSGDHLLP